MRGPEYGVGPVRSLCRFCLNVLLSGREVCNGGRGACGWLGVRWVVRPL